ncbi:MAG TPA: HAD-IA family hydrolase [Gemmataceae bacterium]|nr:HAD-IA family hydrolase [Gemmataceae bacterium]
MRYTFVLWDFDGTLADTFSCTVSAYNRLAVRRGLRPMTDPGAARGLTPLALLRTLNIPLVRVPSLLSGLLSAVARDMPAVRLFPKMPEILDAFVRGGCRMSVLSSNSRDNILTCLRANGVADHFESILGYRRIVGKGEGIRRFLKERAAAGERAVYVGDEVRDIQAARKAGVDVAAVAWGYNTSELLAKQAPDYLMERPEQLLSLLD